jgi:hypothetical protein
MKTMVEPQPDDTRTPFERFNDLARQVFVVPKEEIDKRQAEYEKQQARKKKQKKPK